MTTQANNSIPPDLEAKKARRFLLWCAGLVVVGIFSAVVLLAYGIFQMRKSVATITQVAVLKTPEQPSTRPPPSPITPVAQPIVPVNVDHLGNFVQPVRVPAPSKSIADHSAAESSSQGTGTETNAIQDMIRQKMGTNPSLQKLAPDSAVLIKQVRAINEQLANGGAEAQQIQHFMDQLPDDQRAALQSVLQNPDALESALANPQAPAQSQ